MRKVIEIRNLGKKYRVGTKRSYLTLRDEIMSILGKPIGVIAGLKKTKHRDSEEFWALKDINFEVYEGEILAIIGRNGAGKSTLLKILSRITPPTTGQVTIYGNVASLLEVGTGFHQELTGRENIFLNGAILGMKKIDIEKRMEEIIDFSEVRQFIDTPVKYYSSGMYTRLAFSVAAHLEPDILIIDEVLAVGDLYFQQKCHKMIRSYMEKGKTVLMVSHNMAVVEKLAQRAVLIDKGEVEYLGDINKALKIYSDRTIF